MMVYCSKDRFFFSLRACLGIGGMKGNEGHWGGGISIITQNFPKSPLILFHPLQSSISQTSPKWSKHTITNTASVCQEEGVRAFLGFGKRQIKAIGVACLVAVSVCPWYLAQT
jgi:hypothetical protein